MCYNYNKEKKTVGNVFDLLFNLDSFKSGEVKFENFENTKHLRKTYHNTLQNTSVLSVENTYKTKCIFGTAQL